MREAFVAGLSRSYDVHAYSKWGGAFWRLLSLVDLGVELLHRVVFSHRTGEPAHPSMLKLHFPAYWHYDLLAGLRTLAASGSLADERAGNALELLVEKRGTDGTWRTQGRWWKKPGSNGSNVEVVEWGGAANELLTEQAQGVLHAAGRL